MKPEKSLRERGQKLTEKINHLMLGNGVKSIPKKHEKQQPNYNVTGKTK